MDKTKYCSLTTGERINYLNSRIETGESLFKICKEIGIANNVSTEFKKHGWIRNEQGLYVKQEQAHPGQLTIEDKPPQPTMAQEATITEEEKIVPTQETKPLEAEMATPEATSPTNEVRTVGRPKREGKVKKITLEIPDDLHRALMIYKADKGLYINELVQDLLRTNIPDKYFRPL